MEADAFRRLFPTQYIERYLDASVRPDGRPLGRARPTEISLGQVPTTDGSALVKLGNTTMLAGVKLEVFVPGTETPDEGRIAVDFQMPPICSPHIRPGRPVEAVSVINEQLSNALASSEFVNLRELSITNGKAAWLACLDIYCLDSDGSLVDAALLACVAAFADLQIPAVSINDDGKVQRVSGNTDQAIDVDESGLDKVGMEKGSSQDQMTLKAKRRLKLGAVPVALTCLLHTKYLLADPTAEEEAVLHTIFTVVVEATGKLVSMYKPGGSTLATTSTVQDCIALAHLRVKEVQQLLKEAVETASEVEEPS
ncbi:unnamed protein product [Calypogeia fissa]